MTQWNRLRRMYRRIRRREWSTQFHTAPRWPGTWATAVSRSACSCVTTSASLLLSPSLVTTRDSAREGAAEAAQEEGSDLPVKTLPGPAEAGCPLAPGQVRDGRRDSAAPGETANPIASLDRPVRSLSVAAAAAATTPARWRCSHTSWKSAFQIESTSERSGASGRGSPAGKVADLGEVEGDVPSDICERVRVGLGGWVGGARCAGEGASRLQRVMRNASQDWARRGAVDSSTRFGVGDAERETGLEVAEVGAEVRVGTDISEHVILGQGEVYEG